MIIIPIVIYVIITAGIILFHISLFFGMPLGAYTLGGKYGSVIPQNKRYIPLLSAGILAGFLFVKLNRVLQSNYPIYVIASWIITVFFILSIIAHCFTPSKKEKKVMLPINIILGVCSLLISMH